MTEIEDQYEEYLVSLPPWDTPLTWEQWLCQLSNADYLQYQLFMEHSGEPGSEVVSGMSQDSGNT